MSRALWLSAQPSWQKAHNHPTAKPIALNLFCCSHSPELGRDVRQVLPSPTASSEGPDLYVPYMGTPKLSLPKLLCTVQEDEVKAARRDWSHLWSSIQHGFGTVVDPGAQEAFEEVANIQKRSLVLFPACSEGPQEKGMACRGRGQHCAWCQEGDCYPSAGATSQSHKVGFFPSAAHLAHPPAHPRDCCKLYWSPT